MKPASTNTVNERAPFVEYLVPIFKYYSAVYQDINFQWVVVGDDMESALIESSGRDASTPRTWDTRLRCLKLFDLMFCARTLQIKNCYIRELSITG
ncbi:hypothetical protein A0J61_10822 [Choanephora cucurbitarum]|uniref:Uncharacterized protein n=1 Tax=Choanephora cucurbitarum TaxID=101091 RepID=A0A1C7MXK7_9FUNG|nr:hypothetical protein A0J61_10822 [Choanephora cucurbitarum]